MIELPYAFSENQSITAEKSPTAKRYFGRIPKNPCQTSSMQLPMEVIPCHHGKQP